MVDMVVSMVAVAKNGFSNVIISWCAMYQSCLRVGYFTGPLVVTFQELEPPRGRFSRQEIDAGAIFEVWTQ